jgi:exodeoxyribonuclease VII small subunit
MPEDSYSFAQARLRLEEIVSQVRKKDVSLEKSLDLLEEGVRLANQCTELIDHADWEAAGTASSGEALASSPGEESPASGLAAGAGDVDDAMGGVASASVAEGDEGPEDSIPA